MVEYGGGIENGPAGQVSGGTPLGNGGGVDLGGSVGNFIDGAVHQVTTMEPAWLVVWVVVIFLGLVMLRRAF
jgi:hypothetical protein